MIKEQVLPGQCIWDLAAMYYGAPEGIEYLIRDNPGIFNLENTPVPGTIFFVREEVIDKKNVNFFAALVIKPATAVDQLYIPTNWILATGGWDDDGFWIDNALWID